MATLLVPGRPRWPLEGCVGKSRAGSSRGIGELTVSVVLGDRDVDGERAPLPCKMDTTDFQSKELRDATIIGTILKDCYTSARVIPPPAVYEAIKNCLMGTLDLRQSLKYLASDGSSTKSFPFPQQLKYCTNYSQMSRACHSREENGILVATNKHSVLPTQHTFCG